MPNMNPKKLPAREQAPEVRSHNFEEVSQGYDEAMAVEEAERCLHCKHQPCVSGCPVNVRIPEFLALVKERRFLEAYEVVRSTNALPAICGRVCPQETQCESKCVRGIKGEPVGIGRLERFVADYAMAHGAAPAEQAAPNGRRVAVVGSGPAGLTCAGDLKKLGYDVTVFEALHTPGGVLVYGIPEFRLPKDLVRREIRTLEDMGVKIETNMVIGRCIELDELPRSPTLYSVELSESGAQTAAQALLGQKAAQPGDIVTLSPACAAFDQFKNFAVRGRAYKELVGSLT